MKSVFTLLIFIGFNTAFAQKYFERLMHIGINNDLYEGDYLHSVFLLNNNSFLIAGNDKGTNNNKGAFVLSLNAKGDSLFTKYYGFDAKKMIKLLNGNYCLAGTDTNSNVINTIKLIEIDSLGNTVNIKTPTYKTTPSLEYFNCLQQTPDSGFVFSTYTNTNNGFVSTLTKLKANFSKAWQLSDTIFNNAYIRKTITDTSNNTWLIVCKKLGLYSYQSSLLKINSNGAIVLSKTFAAPQSLSLYDFLVDEKKQIICMGVGTNKASGTTLENAIAIKLDSNLNVLWSKFYAPYTTWYSDNLTKIIATNDGNFALCGSITRSLYSANVNYGCQSAALIKISPAGNLLWANVYDNDQAYYNNGKGWIDGTVQAVQSMVQNKNGDYLLVGAKEFLADKNNFNKGFRSYIVLANDSGNIGKYSSFNATTEIENTIQPTIFPNPAQKQINIQYAQNSILKIEIYNSNGILVLNNNIDKNTIDIEALSDGLYFINCYTAEKIFSKKIIIKH